MYDSCIVELCGLSVYVALSRSRGRDTIRLLRDFDRKTLQSPLNEHLQKEDELGNADGKSLGFPICLTERMR